jgi:hypothetical protein
MHRIACSISTVVIAENIVIFVCYLLRVIVRASDLKSSIVCEIGVYFG